MVTDKTLRKTGDSPARLPGSKSVVVDMFCGAGGESSGIMSAAGALDMNIELHAINHWEVAMNTHQANYPDAKPHCESIQSLDPVKVVPGRRVALLWASPECTHHSVARGGRPCSYQSRASAWLILKWLQELYVERVIVENVPEFMNWGPLGADGAPLKSGRGETFRAWVNAIQSLGYTVDKRILTAADYGAPTTRRRLFVQAVRGNKSIVWPAASHEAEPGLFGTKAWIPARDVIDWTIPGTSIFERKKPLSENTIRRIECGIKKFWGKYADPFLVVLNGTTSGHLNRSVHSVSETVPTVTTAPHIGVVQPFITSYHGGNPDRNYSIGEPLPVVDCSNRYGLVQPLILHQMSGMDCIPISKPLPTVTTKSAHALIEPFLVQYYGNGDARSINAPLDTVTCRDRFALIDGIPHLLDIRFRMLAPHELAAAQGFAKGYVFTGTKSDQVKQIGNAVPPPFAEALSMAAWGAQAS